MKVYSLAQDYKHIEVYGKLSGWTDELIKGQQYLAHRQDAPFDTVEITDSGAIVRFQDLDASMKKLFGGVK